MIDDWRHKINEIDVQVLNLLNQRAELVIEIAAEKKAKKLRIHDEKREEEIIQTLYRMNFGPLSTQAIDRIYQSIFGEMKKIQLEVIEQ